MINNALTVTQVNTYIKALLDEDIHLKNIFIVGSALFSFGAYLFHT